MLHIASTPLRVTGARRQPPFAIPNLEKSGLPSLLRRLLLRLLPRAPRFNQLLALSTTAVSIVIQRLALTTRLLRRLLLRFFLPLMLQFGLIPFLRFLHFAAAAVAPRR